MKSILKWLKVIRLGTLIITFCPIAIGIIIASKTPNVEINWLVAVITLICGMSLQALTNMVNDYYDFKRGLDNKDYIGYEKPLVAGLVTMEELKKGIGVDLGIAILLGSYLIYNGGLPILIIGVFSIITAIFYTATNKSLSHFGIGDIFVFIVFGSMASVGTTYLQTGGFSLESMWLGMVCGSIATNVLAVDNIRDKESDGAANRKSIVVRFGRRAGEIEYLLFVILSLVFSFLAKSWSILNLIFIIGMILFFLLLKTRGEKYNSILMSTSFSNVFFLILVLIQYLIIQ